MISAWCRHHLVAATVIMATASACVERSNVEVLIHGAAIHGANGIIFDAQDRLHIASVAGREIVVMDPESGEIVDRYGVDRGVDTPDDLAFGPDGSLYWTGDLTGHVGRLSPEGEITVQFVAPGVNPITFSDDGRLFVALDFLGDALYELDPGLGQPPRLIAQELGWLNGMDWGPDGFLYGPIWTKGQVARVDVATGTVVTVAEGFDIPAAVKFDSRGRLHVVEQLRGEIIRVDTETGRKEVVGWIAPGADNLAFDSSDRLFVSSWVDGSIVEVQADGSTRTVREGGLIAPGGIAVVQDGSGETVFVADLASLRTINVATGETSVERSFIGVPGIVSPFTVSADRGNLILTSWFDAVVQVWDPAAGESVALYEVPALPLDAVRFGKDLVVAELQTASVVRISGPRESDRETLVSGLGMPTGLATAGGDLWVADYAKGTVLHLIDNGRPLSEPGIVATALEAPEGLAVAADGTLLVVEAGRGRLLRIDIETGEVSVVAEGLALGAEGPPGMPPTWIFNGVAVGPSGAVYVTGDVENVVYRIEVGR